MARTMKDSGVEWIGLVPDNWKVLRNKNCFELEKNIVGDSFKQYELLSLTKKVAKPAVFYGGKYRIIDFPLSNAANSGITNVGVLTQYESVALNNYIGNGSHWGIDGNNSVAGILPPRQTEEGLSWYSGTADAIYQNIAFLDELNPTYVLILSGDHIYKMNYAKMLDYHKKHNADLTVAVLNVSLEEASRFGIMNVNEDYSIYEFEEKPKKPKSTLASMGIYIFTYKTLRDELIKDAKDKESEHDFGKNIIPNLLAKHKRLFAYEFEGYWKDVGTIASLWQANMDLLDENDPLKLYEDKNFKILSQDTKSLPQYVGTKAKIVNSIVNQGARVEGSVKNSVIFTEAVIESGATVIDSVIMPGAVIKSGAYVNKAIVADNVVIASSRRENEEGQEIVLLSK